MVQFVVHFKVRGAAYCTGPFDSKHEALLWSFFKMHGTDESSASFQPVIDPDEAAELIAAIGATNNEASGKKP